MSIINNNIINTLDDMLKLISIKIEVYEVEDVFDEMTNVRLENQINYTIKFNCGEDKPIYSTYMYTLAEDDYNLFIDSDIIHFITKYILSPRVEFKFNNKITPIYNYFVNKNTNININSPRFLIDLSMYDDNNIDEIMINGVNVYCTGVVNGMTFNDVSICNNHDMSENIHQIMNFIIRKDINSYNSMNDFFDGLKNLQNELNSVLTRKITPLNLSTKIKDSILSGVTNKEFNII